MWEICEELKSGYLQERVLLQHTTCHLLEKSVIKIPRLNVVFRPSSLNFKILWDFYLKCLFLKIFRWDQEKVEQRKGKEEHQELRWTLPARSFQLIIGMKYFSDIPEG